MKNLKYITLFSSLLLLTGTLSSCGEDKPKVEPKKATIKLIENDNASISSSLDITKEYSAGTEGTLTIQGLNKYTIEGATQTYNKKTKELTLKEGSTDVYTFKLGEGVNKFEAITSDFPVYDPSSIVLNVPETITVTNSLDTEDVSMGEYGQLEIKEKDGYRVTKVTQNKTTVLSRTEKTVNTYSYYVEEGVNTFDFEVIETKDLPAATFDITEDPKFEITKEFTNTNLKAGDRGLLKFKGLSHDYVTDVKINDKDLEALEFNEETKNFIYIVELDEGENKLTYSTYNRPATIKEIVTPKGAKNLSCTLNYGETYYKGDTGVISFELEENYYSVNVLQNGFHDCPRYNDLRNSFEFMLLEGENTFEVEVEYFENTYGDVDIIEGPENRFDLDGTLTDDIDEKPSLGGTPIAPVPSYPNGKEIFFVSKLWWNNQDAWTSIICFDNNKTEIKRASTGVYGSPMRRVFEDKNDLYKVTRWVIDFDTTKYVQFVRTPKDGNSDYNARTGILPVPNFTTNNAYELGNESKWFDKDSFAPATLVNVTNPSTYKPDIPPHHGVYTLDIIPNKSMNSKIAQGYELKAYCFDPTGNGDWPGALIEENGGVYSYDLKTFLHKVVIISVSKNGKTDGNSDQTVDIRLNFEEYGDDAHLEIKIKDSTGDKCEVEIKKI